MEIQPYEANLDKQSTKNDENIFFLLSSLELIKLNHIFFILENPNYFKK
jgi:hypothetical protein